MQDQLQLPVLPSATARVSVAPPGIAPPQEPSSSPVQAGAPPAGARSPVPGLVLAALGVLAGGALLIRAALGLPDDLWGRLDGGGLADAKLLGMAACLTAGGCFAVGRGLVRRGRADRTAAAVCLSVVVPLGAFAAAGAMTKAATPPDRRLSDPTVPYTFSYPGYWSQESADAVPLIPGTGLGVEVSKRANQHMISGAVVWAMVPPSGRSLTDWLHATGDSGVHVVHEEQRMVAGRPALEVDYQRRPGVPFESRTAFFVGRTAFVVTCVMEEEPDLARAGCKKVLDTFAIKAEASPNGGDGKQSRPNLN